ncbi:MAG TPA: response regulator transcription factor [Solirubrobacteraceae bacterium]|nr:response regulator transcription factor [Solirubrobacteraceae bacterium]
MEASVADVGAYGDEASQGRKLKVLIADDHPLLLAGIRRTLEGDPGVEIVGEARSGPEVLAQIPRRLPDVVLLDLRMPGVVGADCVAQIAHGWPGVKCVVLSAESSEAVVEEALSAGASAYVVKSVTPIDLASVVRQAACGAIFHSRGHSRPPGPVASDEPSGPTLTSRERAILAAVAAGLTTAAISKELWVSEHTVKFHLTNVYRKLGVSNRAGAVKYALEHGIG